MVKGSLVLAVVLSSFAVACSVGAPAGQELFSSSSGTTPTPTPSPNPTPTPSPPCLDARECAAGETLYDTVTECTSAGEDRCRLVTPRCGGSSWYCGQGIANCGAYPSCDDGDAQVISCSSGDDCYTRTVCGTTITCKRPDANCKALPTCDPGDPKVTDLDDCKLASSDCYSRTTCGVTIWCNNVN